MEYSLHGYEVVNTWKQTIAMKLTHVSTAANEDRITEELFEVLSWVYTVGEMSVAVESVLFNPCSLEEHVQHCSSKTTLIMFKNVRTVLKLLEYITCAPVPENNTKCEAENIAVFAESIA